MNFKPPAAPRVGGYSNGWLEVVRLNVVSGKRSVIEVFLSTTKFIVKQKLNA